MREVEEDSLRKSLGVWIGASAGLYPRDSACDQGVATKARRRGVLARLRWDCSGDRLCHEMRGPESPTYRGFSTEEGCSAGGRALPPVAGHVGAGLAVIRTNRREVSLE